MFFKICGVTSVDDAMAVCAAGADWIGLNFHPQSPRFVTTDVAEQIVASLPSRVPAVGVFVNRRVSEVAQIGRQLRLAAVQLHGDEPPEDVQSLSHDFQVIRAFRLRDMNSITLMNDYLNRVRSLSAAPFAVLVDAYASGMPGGTGQTIAAQILASLPRTERLILAGGLTPENVAERVARVRPWMVDVASGVESAPGKKDPAKLAAFVAAARRGWGRAEQR